MSSPSHCRTTVGSRRKTLSTPHPRPLTVGRALYVLGHHLPATRRRGAPDGFERPVQTDRLTEVRLEEGGDGREVGAGAPAIRPPIRAYHANAHPALCHSLCLICWVVAGHSVSAAVLRTASYPASMAGSCCSPQVLPNWRGNCGTQY